MPSAVAYYVDPNGETVEASADQADALAPLGYTPATPEQAADFQARDRRAKLYGSTPQAILAGAEAAGRALTLGGSSYLERALGVSPEAIAAREAENPIAAGVGTALGIVAPLILTGGTAALAEGAAQTGVGAGLAAASEATAPALVSRLGRAVAGRLAGEGADLGVATRGLLPEASTAAGQIVRRATAAGAGSAVEGAAYGAGQVVHESALGDPNLTAQSALATIGLSAALGGGLGGAGGALGALAHETAERFGPKAGGSGVAAKLREWLGEVEGTRNLKAAGGIQSDFNREAKKIGLDNLNAVGREAGELGLVGPFSTPAKTLERAEALKASAGDEMGSILREADATAPPTAMPNIRSVLTRARRNVLRPLENNPLETTSATRLATLLDDFEAKFEREFARNRNSAAALGMPSEEIAAYKDRIMFEALHTMRRQIDKTLYGFKGNLDPFVNAYKDALHELRGIVSDELTTAFDRTAAASSDAWKAASRKFQVASIIADFAEKGVERSRGNNLISLTELMSGIGGGVAAGPAIGLAAGAGAAFARRQSAGIIGALAGAGRRALEGAPAAAEAAAPAAEREAVQAATPAVGEAAAAGTSPVPAAWQAGDGGIEKPLEMPSPSPAPAPATVPSTPEQPPERVAALGTLERNNNSVSQRINSLASTLVRMGPRAANVGRSEVAAGVARAFGRSPERSAAVFTKTAERLGVLANDPEQLLLALDTQSEDWHEHAPDTSQALAIASSRGVAFLASKLPRPVAGRAPLAPKWQPSRSEVAQFQRYEEAVENPLSVLKEAAAGTLTPEAVEAVRAVYPDLYDRMRTAAIEQLAAHPSPPYRARLMLSMLLGEDLDGTLASVAPNQASYAAPTRRPSAQPPPGAAPITLASRSRTPQQAALARAGESR